MSVSPRPIEYCQGLNYLAAVFLTVYSRDERSACECFLHFLFETGAFDNFEGGFCRVQTSCRELNAYCLLHCPRTRRLLEVHEINLQIFTFTWILLFFVYNVQNQIELLDTLMPIWDQMLLRGPSIILRTAKLFLKLLEDHLDENSELTYEQVIAVLRGTSMLLLIKSSFRVACGSFLRISAKAWQTVERRRRLSGTPQPNGTQENAGSKTSFPVQFVI
eukprot:Gregarina_sp_Poly_1__8777@NODE_526_length_7686_cov_239_700617_g417_i0_p3_GENE_NODE_526_length_7686_cov_239_700617_g417_i0NODE_526_length_7686_cov_239_700617_g417_i0_p3_ORF_typecomplete_len219_score26_14RabGAPTBC/PF00566_18/9_3e22_NODE_526_length_7686_cov_239_700617_g417_i010851741